MAVRVQIIVFCVVILYSAVSGYQYFGKTLTLGGSRMHQNTGNHLHDYILPQPSRQPERPTMSSHETASTHTDHQHHCE
jgi:hypothetical protein